VGLSRYATFYGRKKAAIKQLWKELHMWWSDLALTGVTWVSVYILFAKGNWANVFSQIGLYASWTIYYSCLSLQHSGWVGRSVPALIILSAIGWIVFFSNRLITCSSDS
jgi:hypothetical protein